MSFQIQTATTFVRLTLTDVGRQKVAQGTFNMNQVIFSDREVNYAFNRRYENTVDFSNLNPFSNNLYNPEQNKILSSQFAAAGLPLRNFDGTLPYDVSESIIKSTQVLTAETPSRGIWSAITSGSNSQIGNYILDSNKYLYSSTTDSTQISGGFSFQIFNTLLLPPEGLMIKMVFQPPTNTTANLNGNAPHYTQWYRHRYYDGIEHDCFLDRITPNFSSGNTTSHMYFYPLSATTDFWNSDTSSPGDVWSLSIVRTSHVMGTRVTTINDGFGYTNYGSKEFNGTKRFFGLNEDFPIIGFVWHKDKFTGQTYGDLLMPRTTQLDLPDIMWHRKPGFLPGKCNVKGHRFTDYSSEILYDEIAKSNYTILYDGIDPNKIAVGRVYYELKLIMIIDQELLTVMSYKSNRNYTLPKLKVELSSTSNSKSGAPFITAGKTYYFSYYMHQGGPFSAQTSYGFQDGYPCANWAVIQGQNAPDGTALYPNITLDPQGFPYMRAYDEFNSFSGTGWAGNLFQIIFNELDNSQEGALGADSTRPNRWWAVDNAISLVNDNGVYTSEPGETTLNPNFMGTRQFSFGQDNFGIPFGRTVYNNATYYSLPNVMSTFLDVEGQTGLTWGNELFLNGNVKTVCGLRTEKIIATVNVGKDELNASLKESFKGSKDENTYITEVGVFDDAGSLVAVGKPTYPVRKNPSRHLLFQLEINI